MSALLKACGYVVVLILVIAVIQWLRDEPFDGDAVPLAIGFSALIRTFDRRTA